MINITVGRGIYHKTLNNKDESTYTLREAVTEGGLDYTAVQFHLNADIVTNDMWDKTFAQCDIYDDCFVTAVAKAEGN